MHILLELCFPIPQSVKATIRTIRTTRTIRHSPLFAVRYSRLFAIRVFQTPSVNEFIDSIQYRHCKKSCLRNGKHVAIKFYYNSTYTQMRMLQTDWLSDRSLSTMLVKQDQNVEE